MNEQLMLDEYGNLITAKELMLRKEAERMQQGQVQRMPEPKVNFQALAEPKRAQTKVMMPELPTEQPAAMPQQSMPSPRPSAPQTPAPSAPQSQEPQGLLARLFGDGDNRRRIGAELMMMSAAPQFQKMGAARLAGIEEAAQERKATEVATAQRNKTIEYLVNNGRKDLAEQVMAGLPPMEALKLINAVPKDARTALQKDFEYAKQQGYGGDFTQFIKDKGAGVNVNIGDKPSKLDETLMAEQGKMYATYLRAGDASAALIPELNTLEALASQAPNGPLQGRLAEMFPEATNASAAFMSMVQRLAPTLRVEGSGSTSDIEFKSMLNSLGSLRNTPEANKMIYDAFRRKAVLDQARAEAVRMYQAGTYTAQQLNAQLGKLNSERILSDDLRRMIDPDNAIQVDIPAVAPANLPESVRGIWDVMTDEQKRKFLR